MSKNAAEVYAERRAELLEELKQLFLGNHMSLLCRVAELTKEYEERIEQNERMRAEEIQQAERDCEEEKKAAKQEFLQQKDELLKTLIMKGERRRQMLTEEFVRETVHDSSIRHSLRSYYMEGAAAPPEGASKKRVCDMQFVLAGAHIEEDLNEIKVGVEQSKNEMKWAPSSLDYLMDVVTCEVDEPLDLSMKKGGNMEG